MRNDKSFKEKVLEVPDEVLELPNEDDSLSADSVSDDSNLLEDEVILSSEGKKKVDCND